MLEGCRPAGPFALQATGAPRRCQMPAQVVASPDGAAPTTLCCCGHQPHEHDAVATRYCAATTVSALDRACICAGMPTRPAQSYDRR
jgi:hypothetical protein